MDLKINLFKYLLILLSLCMSVSCEDEHDIGIQLKKTQLFSLDKSLNSETTNLDINRFIKLEKAVILEFPENFAIQNIHKIIVSEPSMFILDNVQNFIFVYDLEGNFLNRIGGIGDGPGEYLEITDFTITNDDLVVFSNNSRKIIHYSSIGKFIKEFPILHYGSSLAVFDQGYIIQTKNNVHPQMPYDLLFLNNSGEMVDQKQQAYPNFPSFESSGFLKNVSAGKILYMNVFGNIIYQVNEELDLIPLYKFDLGSDALHMDKFDNPQELSNHFHEFTHLTNLYWENDSLALLYFHHDLRRLFGLVSKSEGCLYTFNQFEKNEILDVLRSIKAADIDDD